MKKIRWGIIGPGIIAHEFANDFKLVDNAELIAVASTNQVRAREFADKFSMPLYFDNYEELYTNNNIDAIYVATPHVFHRQNSENALRNMKAVLCEKPLTHNLHDSLELIKTAKENDSYLMEGMWTYFLPAIKKAKQWVADGRIGNIKHIKADFGYPCDFNPDSRFYDPKLGGGSILDIGIYTLAIALYFLDSSPKNMNIISKKAITGVDTDVNMQFEYENATASLSCSFEVKLHNWAFIIGDKGYIAIPDFWRAKECSLYEGEIITDSFIEKRNSFGFEYEIEAVSNDLLLKKKESDIMKHKTSIELAELMEKVMKKI